jgi:hypothetical protein
MLLWQGLSGVRCCFLYMNPQRGYAVLSTPCSMHLASVNRSPESHINPQHLSYDH